MRQPLLHTSSAAPRDDQKDTPPNTLYCSRDDNFAGGQDNALQTTGDKCPGPSSPFGGRRDTREMRCGGCGGRIVDRFYLLAADLRWHLSCLRCSHCQETLDTHRTCYAKDGSIYCRRDYNTLFPAGRCAGCSAAVHRDDLVMRVRDLVFHVGCFACDACGQLLTKGQQFGLREGRIFCTGHLASGVQDDCRSEITDPEDELVLRSAFVPCKKQTKRRRIAASSGEEHAGEEEGSESPHQRSKRMRTSFKHGQLRAMKEYFAANHNPDAKDLRQLSLRTGLSKRVLQVWFQNARAKWRRNLLRQGTHGPEVAQDTTLLMEVTSEGEECHILKEQNALSPSPPPAPSQHPRMMLQAAPCCS